MIRKVKNRRQVHRGCVLMDDKENRYLVLEVNLFKGSLTAPTGKPVGFWLASVACNRTSFSDFGFTSVNLFESELSLPSSPTTTLTVNFCLTARKYSQSP